MHKAYILYVAMVSLAGSNNIGETHAGSNKAVVDGANSYNY